MTAMMSQRRWTGRCSAGLLGAALLLASGCRAWVTSVQLPPGAERPDPTQPPRVHRETGQGPARAAIRRTAAGLDVQAATPSYCRDTTVTATVANRTTEHDLSVGGWLGQLVAGGGAVALGVSGGLLLADPCAAATAVLWRSPCRFSKK